MPTHQELVDAARSAIEIEKALDAKWRFVPRLRWLTEAELVTRLHSSLVSSKAIGVQDIRASAQGKRQQGGTNFDLVFHAGPQLLGAAEVVYSFAAKGEADYQPTQAEYLNDDIAWLVGEGDPVERHVVAFFPKLVPGYGVQRCPRPFRLDGSEFDRPADALVLTDTLQATSLSEHAKEAFKDLFIEVVEPTAGRKPRWSFAGGCLPPNAHPTVGGKATTRTIVADTSSPLWAVVLSLLSRGAP